MLTFATQLSSHALLHPALFSAMLRSYVCRQCRLQSRKIVTTPGNPQWQSRATFISLRSSQPPPESRADQAPEHNTQHDTGRQIHREGSDETSEVKPAIRYEPEPESVRPGRYSRLGLGSDPIPSDTTTTVAHSDTTSPAYAQAIKNLLDQRNVQGAWDLFLREFSSRDSPAFTNPSPDDISLLQGSAVFIRLLNATTLQFCNGVVMDAKPTDVIFRFEQLGIATERMWPNVIGYTTDQLLWLVSGASQNKQTPDVLLSELISLWCLFFQCRGTARDPLESINRDWRYIPDVQSLSKLHKDDRFSQRLQRYHPRAQTHSSLQFSAVTVFNLFDEVNQGILKVPEALREHTTPFIRLLTYLLAGSKVDSALSHPARSPALKHLPREFIATLEDQINSAPHLAMRVFGAQSRPENNPGETATATFDQVLSEEEQYANLEAFHLKRIARAVESQSNAATLEKLWDEIKISYRKGEKINIPPVLYNAFLSGFMQLFQPDMTAEVWNFMIARGVEPDIRTWVAMLDGCVKARDLNGLNGIWDRMIQSGTEPDDYAWTTRIHGLISLKQINEGFKAMDEMGKRWVVAQHSTKSLPVHAKGKKMAAKRVSSSRKVDHGVTKPTVAVINGAISALINIPTAALRQNRKVAYVQKVLEWSRNFAITPDIVTYNNLVKMYLRADDSVMVFHLFKQMAKEGIQGDMVTYTMLLSAAFNSQRLKDLSESDQATYVIQILNDLEADGLELNAYIYSSAIDRLLKLYGNVSAVMTVMNHMAARNISVSAQINTTIITHCFQQTPPDIVSVDNIVGRIFGPGALPTDNLLFNRIIEGYAANREVEKMMSVVTRMSTHGKLPGWEALTAVVRALAEAGEWDNFRELVREVEMGEGIAKGGVTGTAAHRHAFFSVVRNLGRSLPESLAGDFLKAHPAQDGSDVDDELGGRAPADTEVDRHSTSVQ